MMGAAKREVWWVLNWLLLAWAGLGLEIPFGTTHAAEAAPALAPVHFSVAGGVYLTNITVSLSASPASARIYFTTDGSIPTEKSPRYSEPLSISNCVAVKAKAFDSGQASPTACENYTLLEETLASFSSN